jgi:dienelactone hydrolase
MQQPTTELQPAQTHTWHPAHWLAAVAGLVLMAAGLIGLLGGYSGLTVESTRVGEVPITVMEPKGAPPGPVVVVAHGFAGSRQLMHPFAVSLARNGYRAVLFDFPGHGRNAELLAGEIGEEARAESLLRAQSVAVDFARGLPGSDGRLALLGHSMAGDIATRYVAGQAEQTEGSDGPEVSAIVAVSPYLSLPLDQLPTTNLQFIFGAWEPRMVQDQGRAAVADTGGIEPDAVQLDTIYGSIDEGTARELVVAENVEHIAVLYSAASLRAALRWLDATFDRAPVGGPSPEPVLDRRGPWLGLYFLGVMLLAWPLALRLPRVSEHRQGAGSVDGWGWRRFWPIGVLPAILTPLLLWPVPSDFLALAIGDYIALHFGLYGLLTWVMLWRAGAPLRLAGTRPAALIGAIALVALFETLALALPTDGFVASYLPAPHRLVGVAALFAGTLLWFSADEWLTRGRRAPWVAYALTKGLFLLSLVIAILLDFVTLWLSNSFDIPMESRGLFFLVIIIPAILVLFFLYGLFSGWIYRRTGQPLVAAATNALAFAVAIAVSFPMLD